MILVVIVFNNDIPVYSITKEEHEKHDQAFLYSVVEKKLYEKFKKCEFWSEIPHFSIT